MSINDVTYLSVFLNSESKKPYSDINSIVKLGNCKLADLDFASKRIYTFTAPTIDSKGIQMYKTNEIPYKEFTKFVVLNYPEMFDSEFMINFHCDGFIMNPESWSDDFLNYDYIGPPFDAGGTRPPCSGNGGFSLRSKKFCSEFRELYNNKNIIPDEYKHLPEDYLSCHFLREKLVMKGIKFAPFEVASKFATEHLAHKDEDFYKSFGFHDFILVAKENITEDKLNIDERHISKNPKEVIAMRKKIHQGIFNEN